MFVCIILTVWKHICMHLPCGDQQQYEQFENDVEHSRLSLYVCIYIKECRSFILCVLSFWSFVLHMHCPSLIHHSHSPCCYSIEWKLFHCITICKTTLLICTCNAGQKFLVQTVAHVHVYIHLQTIKAIFLHCYKQTPRSLKTNHRFT